MCYGGNDYVDNHDAYNAVMSIFLLVMTHYNGETGIPSSSSNREEQLNVIYTLQHTIA